jgi:hypothetical protein
MPTSPSGNPSFTALLADVDGTLVTNTKDKVLTKRAIDAVQSL